MKLEVQLKTLKLKFMCLVPLHHLVVATMN